MADNPENPDWLLVIERLQSFSGDYKNNDDGFNTVLKTYHQYLQFGQQQTHYRAVALKGIQDCEKSKKAWAKWRKKKRDKLQPNGR